MERDVSTIIEHLESQNLNGISTGLYLLENLLKNLLPSIEKSYRKTTTQSTPHAQQVLEFLDLQNNFSFNLTSVLIRIYRYDLSPKDILTSNKLLQGLLLLHPQSKTVFNKSENMELILELLNYSFSGYDQSLNIIISAITTLMHILLKNYNNYRVFEANNGCKTIIKNLRLNSINDINNLNDLENNSLSLVQQNLNYKIIEFLMFYTMDEQDNPNPITTEEKVAFFKDEFPEINALVESLNKLIDL
ncbi:uncharacterized protein KGF55_005648 [Candida pseudojiufengensis]|uniref:uncharacterized protein n=1 Tax=Candida pseudojiufengensis TaxID=497109 RepID=UPI002224E160|nr:uncharacterized protein KGF55_005648 [Candida pseudojiufengensis]KAI5958994.1 hypothetical protein KGF55_005648 [Candida pseudojiufengensis]